MYPFDWVPNDSLSTVEAERLLIWYRLIAKIKEEWDALKESASSDAEATNDTDEGSKGSDIDKKDSSPLMISSVAEAANLTPHDMSVLYEKARPLDKRDLYALLCRQSRQVPAPQRNRSSNCSSKTTPEFIAWRRRTKEEHVAPG